MLKRNIENQVIDSLKFARVLLINGPRQAGKTTLVKGLSMRGYSSNYVTFDDFSTLSSAQRDPTGFISQLKRPVIIDEVQRVPEIFLPIKIAVDNSQRRGEFILTGSANVLTLPRLSDSLAGRMEFISLWPFSQGELDGIEENFIDFIFSEKPVIPGCPPINRDELFEKILMGGYPPIQERESEKRRRQWFDGYLTTLMERDIRDLSAVRNLSEFPILFQILATRSGTILNLGEISRTLGLQNETLRRYISLLKAMWLLIELPAWSTNLGRRLIRTPKISLNDTGLMASLLTVNRRRLLREPMLLGQLLESFVVLELKKQATWCETSVKFYHFRDHKGNEVDLVLETPAGELIGIEIKATASPKPDDLNGLRSLKSLVGNRFRRGILLHTGTTAIGTDENLWYLPVSALWQSYKL